MSPVPAVIRAAALFGVEALPVVVEVSVSQGIPGVTIVGMADTAVQEARHRVRCAIRESGFSWPRASLTVNLAPSELRKSGTGFDLPIALAILSSTGQIPTAGFDGCLFVGELGLRGEVCGVRGLVAYERLAAEQGLTLVGPEGCISSSGGATRIVKRLAKFKQGIESLPELPGFQPRPRWADADAGQPDFCDVIDAEMPKRACVVAAAGRHGLLMVGPPGAGKSMLAKRMPTIMPPLSDEERAEALLIHSVAGQDLAHLRAGERPFRAPHHAISRGGLLGGGRPVRPGEVSLAHNGVLFLDEMPEFGPGTLQQLRQPLEDHVVRLVRVEGAYVFPCDFMLVAAANPCPCGYLGDPDHTCVCSPARVQAYQSRIGGPLMDRIDVVVDVARPSSERIVSGERGTTSEQMASQVAAAWDFGSWRRARDGDLPDRMRDVPRLGLDAAARATLTTTARRMGLGGRGVVRIARVARTIADLEESQDVTRDHVAEACMYRTRAAL